MSSVDVQYTRVNDMGDGDEEQPFYDEYAPRDVENDDPTRLHKPAIVSGLEVSARHGFIRKVLSILLLQLLVTFGVVAVFCLNEAAKNFLYEPSTGPTLLYSSIGVSLVSLLVLLCVPNMHRRHPHNLILLGCFTLGESVLVAAASTQVEPKLLMTAVGLTAGLVIVLMLFAVQTKYDFTGHHVYFILGLYFLMAFGLMMGLSGSNGDTMQSIYCWLGIVLFSGFLVIDVQLMIGKNSERQLSVDDYVLCAINLYLDILNLFLRILRMLNNR
jgi:FtsH-binding integral membrane protein